MIQTSLQASSSIGLSGLPLRRQYWNPFPGENLHLSFRKEGVWMCVLHVYINGEVEYLVGRVLII
jgi:hypothetical protein